MGLVRTGAGRGAVQAYYQWVPFVLFLQACVFYTPHALFKLAEGGKVASIISGLHHKGDTPTFIL